MILPSKTKPFRMPFIQIHSLLSGQTECSFALDLRYGFWKSMIGSTMAALRAIEIKAKNNRDSSYMNSFPTLPNDILKQCNLPCKISE